jgi:hypothetical protein
MERKSGRSTGLEPATFGSTIQCSNQLSYDRHRGTYPDKIFRRFLGLFWSKEPKSRLKLFIGIGSEVKVYMERVFCVKLDLLLYR